MTVNRFIDTQIARDIAAGLDETQIAANANVMWLRAYAEDAPAKAWFYGEVVHPAIYRALKVDRSDPAAAYACAPFRLARVDGQHRILAAWPAPPILTGFDDWFDIEQVIAWNPTDNSAEIMGDGLPQLIGAFPTGDTGTIFASPFTFLRAWIEERAAFYTAYRAADAAHFTTAPTEGDTPGCLIIGDAAKVRWNPDALPRNLECAGIDPAQINRAILRSARLPRATNSIRIAA